MKNITAIAASATIASVTALTALTPMPASAAQIQTPEKPALGSVYTGSAPLSITLAVLGIAAATQLIVDSVPPLRQAVDNAAAAAGLQWAPGSSEGNRIFDVQLPTVN